MVETLKHGWDLLRKDILAANIQRAKSIHFLEKEIPFNKLEIHLLFKNLKTPKKSNVFWGLLVYEFLLISSNIDYLFWRL